MCMHHRQDFRELIFNPKGDDVRKTFHRTQPNISIHDRELFGIRFNPHCRRLYFTNKFKAQACSFFLVPISGTEQVQVSRIRKESSPTQFKCLASRKTSEAGIRFCGFESASEMRSSSISRCFCVSGGSPSSAMLSQILPTNSNRAVTERFKISGGTSTGFMRTLQTDSAEDGLNRLRVDSRNDNCATTANREL